MALGSRSAASGFYLCRQGVACSAGARGRSRLMPTHTAGTAHRAQPAAAGQVEQQENARGPARAPI